FHSPLLPSHFLPHLLPLPLFPSPYYLPFPLLLLSSPPFSPLLPLFPSVFLSLSPPPSPPFPLLPPARHP
ncbi:hypothetical protein E0F70_11330, partial [Streptococcus dysgalactiae]